MEVFMNKINVGIIGGTGMVGQRLLTLLSGHPYFRVVLIAASPRSAGMPYARAVEGRWKMPCNIPSEYASMFVRDAGDISMIAAHCRLVFCALSLSKEKTRELEETYARAGIAVVSNNSANRMVPDVPMVIPEVNPEHLSVIPHQRRRLGTARGLIAVKPNCSLQSYVPLLSPLRKFGIREVAVSTYQAVSGAGKILDEFSEISDNVIPFIAGEEEKSRTEPHKIWGRVEHGEILPAPAPVITARCLRVPVSDGHMASVFVNFDRKPTKEEIIECWQTYGQYSQIHALPHAPKQFLTYFEEDDRPQPRLDRDLYGGMGISVGRLCEDPLFDYSFVGLSHNTLRGAAGGALLIAELLRQTGYLN